MYRRGASKTDKPPKEESAGSKYAELLVFGYACKLFRDDERAAFHEHGKHLIPWMGDSKLMIDRYDGRGHLHDLSEYDAGSWNQNYQLSEEEARIEALCDEERYLALHTDLLEEEARQEEEYKRLSEALADEGSYNAVAFRYSADYYDPSQPTEEEDGNKDKEPEPQEEDGEEPFVAPPGLIIPSDVELPATIKTHAIIERTANFVCKQGAQFEIVLKAKQAGNSQFDFLRFDHYLNPYYKHILRAMKEGRYTAASESKQDQTRGNCKEAEEEDDDDDDDDDEDGNYLHPSLFATKKSSRLEEIMKPLQVMDPDHPLAALIRKAQQEKNGNIAITTKPEEEVAAQVPSTEYTTDPNMAALYYGYCMLPDGTYCLAPPPPGIDASTYYSSMPAGMIPAHSASPAPPPPGTTPPPDSTLTDQSAPTAAAAAAAALPPASAPVSHATPSAFYTTSSSTPQASVSQPSSSSATAIIPPPPDIQPVIDKLAEYVARNGVKFESSVRAKNDPRFDFLQSWHQYNTYYEFKKHYFIQKEASNLPQGSAVHKDGSTANGSSEKESNEGKLIKASFAPICFAIKSKENDMLPLEKNRVRLDDDSDEDRGREEEQEGVDQSMAGVEQQSEPPPPQPEEKKPTLSQEELEAKQAKQKLEDRLAAAAREKLAQASKECKEKQLQAERKRKAALFLQALRGPEVEPRRADEPFVPAEPEVSTLPAEPVIQVPLSEYPPPDTSMRSVDPPAITLPLCSSSTSSSTRERDRNRDRDKKKKKHKRRSRSRSRSRSKTKHSLPSAYRSYKRSRSQSHSPSKRERRREERERERERYGGSAYRLGNSPGLGRKRSRSRSRSPRERRKKSSSKSVHRSKASSNSPPASSDRGRASRKVSTHTASSSPTSSPTSSLRSSRDASQEKDKQVSSTIISSVQTKITQDLMAKVRAMLAKGLQPNPS
ncbi:splicing factor, suppressor of white-apricot homolog isoform X2 [Neoarius graeffei]|uniref:splicing factor, suppressor of white-apricot homolog isoform X2 n=1 Tax=Neoarius graeffei TaxID=443677 RepID=UPI00298C5479|nr:splicing factor, suppressor of white-apricot homolog isoform X2 [Neoarius graeffei]